MTSPNLSRAHLDAPVDATSRERLAADGLRLGRVDLADREAFTAWSQAVSRGFHEGVETQERIDQRRGYYGDRRLTGVWDDTLLEPDVPIATVDAWPADLTLPGRTSVPSWAISGVTVAPTHRRRGIARSLIEAELRTAHALGLPVAVLTVSESTIYGRFGFGPAVTAHDLTIDTRRATWTGPEAGGRVQLVGRDQLLDVGHDLVERVRLETPGQVEYGGILWERLFGVLVGDTDANRLRFVRHDDADGVPQGFAIYRLKGDDADFARHVLTVEHLVAATDEAYAALWRFLLEVDLVATVRADLRPPAEPVRWMVADFRAVQAREVDHLWTRVLDVPACLSARTYATSGRIVLEVSDPLGMADGTWALEVGADGTPTVTESDESADARLTVSALSAVLLGGVSAATLRTAGEVAGDAEGVDTIFRSAVTPWTSIWF